PARHRPRRARRHRRRPRRRRPAHAAAGAVGPGEPDVVHPHHAGPPRGVPGAGTVTRRGERGQVAGIEALPFGLLIFVAGTLLVVNIWGVVDTKFAADTAA